MMGIGRGCKVSWMSNEMALPFLVGDRNLSAATKPPSHRLPAEIPVQD